MSYRSALASPSTQSGNVGTTLSTVQTANIPLVTAGQAYITAELLLPKGVWAITSTANIGIVSGASLYNYIFYLKFQDSTGANVNYIQNTRDNGGNVVVAANAASIQNSSSFTLNVTTDGAQLIQYAQGTFSPAGSLVSQIPIGGAGNIWAVKIA